MFNVIVTLCFVVVADGHRVSRLIELSHPLDENTLTWDSRYKFKLVDKLVVDKPPFFYAANNYAGPEHCGTHLDAPYHFNKYGWTVDKIPLNRLIAPGVLVDVSDKVNGNQDFELLPEHLHEWERTYGRIPSGVVLVRFGWSERYDDRVAYFGNITAPYRFPGISAAAADWLVSRNIYGVGLDTPSTDSGRSQTYPVHGIIASAGIYGLENLTFKGIQLLAKGFDVIAMPMKITNGTGAPCRVVVLEYV